MTSPASSTSSAPLLGIRRTSVLPPDQTQGMSEDERMDSLDALLEKESGYSSSDYLHRQRRTEDDSTLSSSTRSAQDSDPSSGQTDPSVVDAACREKMVEWAYRVSDHFKVPRLVVAVAYSYLDRFVGRCSCDRTAFKLASMTALYIAVKTFNGRQLSIATLAELSRGEFEVSHIAEMESIMLRTLDWKLNPPIAQDFVQYFLTFLPEHCPSRNSIALRAMYFVELAVYDYDLILHDRAVLAISAIFNAVESVLGVEDPTLASKIQLLLLTAIQHHYPCCCCPMQGQQHQPRQSSVLVQSTQRRLWYLYSCSAQSVQEKTSVSPDRYERSKQQRPPQSVKARKQFEPKSPTSVHQVATVSPIGNHNKGRF